MPGDFYDVIVVGAGHSGSYTALQLCSRGYKVAVLERKEAPGIDVCCTGIVSRECFDSFGVTPDVILTRADSAKLFSPSGRCLRLESAQVQAYVIDRASFDRALAARAIAAGADYFFSLPAGDIVIDDEGVRIETPRLGLRAKAVVVATGFEPALTRKLGLGSITHFASGAQAEVETEGVDEVEIYLSQEVVPGFFGWLVPTSRGKALAGVLAASHARLCLEKLLKSHFCQGKVLSPRGMIKTKAVPVGTLPRSYGDRLVVIGDAAGQVKPTTGGGIYFGRLGSQAAVAALTGAFNRGDLGARELAGYQKAWKAKIGREISSGYRARRLYQKLSDSQIERLFDIVASRGIAAALVDSPGFSFDWHSRVIVEIIKGVLDRFPGRASPSAGVRGRRGR